MALIEAVLTYRPHGIGSGSDAAITLGATADPRVLTALRDRLLEAARQEVRLWHGIDPGVAALKAAEAERLERVLGFLLPDEEPEIPPGLRLVKPEGPP